MSEENPSNKDFAQFYFVPLNGLWHKQKCVVNTLANKFKCNCCETEVSQNQSSGHGNLFSHSVSCRGGREKMLQEYTEQKKRVFIDGSYQTNFKDFGWSSPDGVNCFNWMEVIIQKGLAFQSCEDPMFLKHFKMKKLSIEKLLKVMDATMMECVEDITRELHEEDIILIIDCWTDDTKTHYCGIFASIKHKTKKDLQGRSIAKTFFLAMAPPQDETSFDADNMANFIRDTCETYGIPAHANGKLHWVVGLVTDNTNVNPAIANKLGIKFIGCRSHRFNLALEFLIDNTVGDSIEKVHELMKAMRTLKHCGHLREQNYFKQPILMNKTRWGGKITMVARYIDMENSHALEQFKQRGHDLRNLFPSYNEFQELKGWLEEMDDAIEITKYLQYEYGVTADDANNIFTEFLAKYDPDGEHNLGSKWLLPNANIVKDKSFESAIIKLQSGKEGLLTLAETTSLSCIRKTPVAVNPMVPLNEPPIRLSILERAGVGAGVGKKPRVDEEVSDSIYKDTEWFPITSNICERLFSKAKLSVGHLRMAMTPMHLEMLMFLNCNRSMWNELTVTRVTKRVWKVVVPPAVAVAAPANADVQPAVLVATPTIGEVALL